MGAIVNRQPSGVIGILLAIAIASALFGCGGGNGDGVNTSPDEDGRPPVTVETWYADMDGDGFGDPHTTMEAAVRPVDHVADASDCQDHDATIHPGATEICGDGVDQNCSGGDLACENNEDPILTWHADTDNDGFGDPHTTKEAVVRPAGYVADASDCQDRDATIHPGATEICGDGVDQDCSGDDLTCEPDPASARFGVITDIHHSNRPDTRTRKYSAALAKTAYFVTRMDAEGVDFVIELGDMVDQTINEKNPLETLSEIDAAFTGFRGPHYHVLGNHEFDSIARMDLLNRLDNTGILAGETYYSFDLNGFHYIVLDADFTATEPHQPFDMIAEGQIAWWDWTEAWVPREELDWLAADLAASDLPTIVFSHQALHLDASAEGAEDFMINNAAEVRSLLEADGQVLAAFSGHDHRGATTTLNRIRYFGLAGNVGLERDWAEVSATNGLDPEEDCPFTLVEIDQIQAPQPNGMDTYRLELRGNAQQYSYSDEVQLAVP